jgi:hypothetical protein
MPPIRKYALATALALFAGATAVIATTAAAETGPSVIRLIVPLSYVHFHATSNGSKAISPGDGFQESWLPPHPATASRQDAVAIATFRKPSSSEPSLSKTDNSSTPAAQTTKTTPCTPSSAEPAPTKAPAER